MSLTPSFELGIWNAWIFMIWILIFPILSNITIKEKEVSKKLRTSVPMRYEKFLNLSSMLAVIIGFLYSIFLPIKFNHPWFLIGLILFMCGFLFDLSVLFTIREAKLDKPFTKGPYKYSRHPIYLSLFLIITSIAIMSISWVFLLIVFIVGIHQLIVSPFEEQYCLKKYGKDYEEYMKMTPRWIGLPKSKTGK
jgi:protein-S-isoprenylcysteine O-methyltransferase Ste14